MNLKAVLEGILFIVGEEGISVENIEEILQINNEELKKIVSELTIDYNDSGRGLVLKVLGNKLKLTTKEEHKKYYEKLVETEDPELSQSALETLAIIAYNEPITRVKVDEIRGISSSHMIRKLVSRDLIEEKGRSDSPGKPILYGVTNKFLDYFGLASTKELPSLEQVEVNDEEIDLFESKYKEIDS
ncbi:MAG: SMC-Scp complex subunit ScpB [Bacilli bacterium]|nr:SMC-Scp complex subunit ScpB [Bacilli bacterium]